MTLSALSLECSERLSRSGVRTIARVSEGQISIDLAVNLPAADLAVVRCVNRPTPQDHAALATMLAEGDFVWAGLVHGEREGSEAVGPIEIFHANDLDRLVARLLELTEALGESR